MVRGDSLSRDRDGVVMKPPYHIYSNDIQRLVRLDDNPALDEDWNLWTRFPRRVSQKDVPDVIPINLKTPVRLEPDHRGRVRRHWGRRVIRFARVEKQHCLLGDV